MGLLGGQRVTATPLIPLTGQHHHNIIQKNIIPTIITPTTITPTIVIPLLKKTILRSTTYYCYVCNNIVIYFESGIPYSSMISLILTTTFRETYGTIAVAPILKAQNVTSEVRASITRYELEFFYFFRICSNPCQTKDKDRVEHRRSPISNHLT